MRITSSQNYKAAICDILQNRCFYKLSITANFKKLKVHRKKPAPESCFNKDVGLQRAILLKETPTQVFPSAY